MKNTLNLLLAFIILLATACAPSQAFGPTLSPSLTITLTPTFTLTPTPNSTPTSTLTPTLTPSPTLLGGGNGKIIFSLAREFFQNEFPTLKGGWNVFLMNLDGTELTPITDGIGNGYLRVESVSPNGKQALLTAITSSKSTGIFGILYLINLSDGTQKIIHNNYFIDPTVGSVSSYWLNNESIVFIAVETGQRRVMLLNIKNAESVILSEPDSTPLSLIPTSEISFVYYDAGCSRCGYRKINLITLEEQEWNTASIVDFAPNVNKIFTRSGFISDLDGNNKIEIDTTSCHRCVFMSPDGSRVIQLFLIEHRGRESLWEVKLWRFPENKSFSISADGNEIYFGDPKWSPDSRLLLFGNKILNTETLSIQVLPRNFEFPFGLWVALGY